MSENPQRSALPTDGNHQVIMGGVSSADGFTPLPVEIDPATGRVLESTTVTDLPTDTYLATEVDASTIGDTVIVAVGGAQTLRLAYLCLSANGANSADVTVTVKTGATVLYKLSLKAGAMFARNIGAGRRYLAGSAGDDLIVELSAAQLVHVNAEYEII